MSQKERLYIVIVIIKGIMNEGINELIKNKQTKIPKNVIIFKY